MRMNDDEGEMKEDEEDDLEKVKADSSYKLFRTAVSNPFTDVSSVKHSSYWILHLNALFLLK